MESDSESVRRSGVAAESDVFDGGLGTDTLGYCLEVVQRLPDLRTQCPPRARGTDRVSARARVRARKRRVAHAPGARRSFAESVSSRRADRTRPPASLHISSVRAPRLRRSRRSGRSSP
jgi:hypothetical protein